MRVVVITPEAFVPGEAAAIERLLRSGAVWRVHLRKPGCPPEAMRSLIEAIPHDLHKCLSLHDAHALAGVYGCGVHLNSRTSVVDAQRCGPVSASCHSLAEVAVRRDADYVFLSPVYDSISKSGYRARFSPEVVRGLVDSRVFALGGVTPEHLPQLASAGFGGGAMLGCVWRDSSASGIDNIIQRISCCNS